MKFEPLQNMLNLPKKSRARDPVSEFICKNPKEYEAEFSKIAVAVIMSRPLMLLMSVSMMSVAYVYYEYSQDWRFLGLLIPLLITGFAYPIYTRFIPMGLRYMALYIHVLVYIGLNICYQLIIVYNYKSLVPNEQFVMIFLLMTILSSFIATSPYFRRMLLLNGACMLILFFAMNHIAQVRGMNIIRNSIQGILLGGAISYVMMILYRYRVYFAFDSQQEIKKKNLELERTNLKLERESAFRMAMAAKATHHLNNPMQAILGLTDDTFTESRGIQNRLEALFPPPSEWTEDIQNAAGAFQKSFSRIQDNYKLMGHSLRRATQIVNELRIVSGVHGSSCRSLALIDIWSSVVTTIEIDEFLSQRTLTIKPLPLAFQNHPVWVEPMAFESAISYLIKEGLEGMPRQSLICMEIIPYESGMRGLSLTIAIESSEPFMQKSIKEWRELSFCQHLLEQFGARLDLNSTRHRLDLLILLKTDGKDMDLPTDTIQS